MKKISIILSITFLILFAQSFVPNVRLNFYNKKKVHKKQIAFHKCKKRNRWVFGGNRSGKTECGAVEVVSIFLFYQN